MIADIPMQKKIRIQNRSITDHIIQNPEPRIQNPEQIFGHRAGR